MDIFEIPLKKERTRPYRLLALLILLVNLMFFVMLAAYTATPKTITTAIVVCSIPALLFVLTKVGKNKWSSHWNSITLALCVMGYLINGYWWAALVMILLAYLYTLAMRPLSVKVSPQFVDFPSLPRKQIAWSELNNILIKGGLLTIDFRNNKLAQLTIADEWYDGNTEKENKFNQFCSQQLNRE